MKISYDEYIKKSNVSVLVAEAIFNGLLSDSPILKIKDVAETTSGGTPLRSNSDFYGGEIPWLKSGDLNDGVIESAEEFITEKGLKASSAKLHPEGTLLVAMYGATAGKTGITKFKASTNQAVCAIFPKDKVTRDYLFWFFRSHRYQYIEKSKGGAQPNISQTVINNTSIPVPDNDIQIQVVSVLDTINSKGKIDVDKIPERFRESVKKVLEFKINVSGISTELTCQLDLVKQLRQAFLREAMQGKHTGNWRKESPDIEPAGVFLKRIKDEKERLIKEGKLKKDKPLPPIKPEEIPFEVPESWVWCRLKDIVQIVGGGTPSKARDDYWNGDIPWVSPKDMYGLTISDSELKITMKGVKNSSANIIPKGSLIIVGRSGILKRKIPVAISQVDCTVNQDMKVLIPIFVSINRFLQYLILGIEKILLAEYVKFGMTVHSLKYTEFENIPIPIPPQSEQERIVAKLDELMRFCDELGESIKGSKKQNEMLLQQVLREALEYKEESLLIR